MAYFIYINAIPDAHGRRRELLRVSPDTEDLELIRQANEATPAAFPAFRAHVLRKYGAKLGDPAFLQAAFGLDQSLEQSEG